MLIFTLPAHTLQVFAWWRHQMETFSALLAICAGNSPVPGEFPTQRPVTRSFDVYFDLRPNKRFSKQSWGWWFETLSSPLWRHRNGILGTNQSKIRVPHYIGAPLILYRSAYAIIMIADVLVEIGRSLLPTTILIRIRLQYKWYYTNSISCFSH